MNRVWSLEYITFEVNSIKFVQLTMLQEVRGQKRPPAIMRPPAKMQPPVSTDSHSLRKKKPTTFYRLPALQFPGLTIMITGFLLLPYTETNSCRRTSRSPNGTGTTVRVDVELIGYLANLGKCWLLSSPSGRARE